MKAFVSAVLFILSINILYAQDSLRSQKSFSIHQGVSYLLTKDLYRSPYVYHGFNPSIAMSFEIKRKKSIQQIDGEYAFGSIRTNFSPLAPIHLFRMNYSYFRKAVDNKRYSFYTGLLLNGQSWTVNYFPIMQAPKYGQVRSYLLAFSLDAAARFEYKINSRSRFKLFVSAPICAFVNRPHFLDGSSDNSKFGVFNYWNPRIHLTYEYDVSKRVSLSINYKYEYLQYAQPKTIRMLNNSLFIGIKLKL